MTLRTSSLSLSILCSLVACADQPYDDDATVCTHATDTLVACGRQLDQSPFGTCQPEQRELAQQVLEVYEADGCAGLADAKADSWTCTVLPFLCVNHSVAELAPFVSDGCSMFPDGTLSDSTLWQQCCVVHDFAYYAGGPESARETADHELQRCIRDAANRGLADLMYVGVRVGGTPSLPTPWRWGYGWTYDPLNGYRSLPAAQASAAAVNVDAYRANPVPPAAIEQRLRALTADIPTVPKLQGYIDLINAAIRQLD